MPYLAWNGPQFSNVLTSGWQSDSPYLASACFNDQMTVTDRVQRVDEKTTTQHSFSTKTKPNSVLPKNNKEITSNMTVFPFWCPDTSMGWSGDSLKIMISENKASSLYSMVFYPPKPAMCTSVMTNLEIGRSYQLSLINVLITVHLELQQLQNREVPPLQQIA